ncbi:hypothetical protein FraEuI1c_1844 [Pseudofrankia inefficax]|uniref:Uncharacterized protein n=1 Tax=Pseudofrankia inefficax (strain DSM 45817 / CECT 9037 / DDB 130130 / EuI1c) TaxID=298654 RepID=E3JCR0_PSEI1|nr:DUF5999 family protein [Pseudofrankia inefficax]ADP79900.1 hypothetical protein FraEuI1c_1844 [Pseudofrankia inefficax]
MGAAGGDSSAASASAHRSAPTPSDDEARHGPAGHPCEHQPACPTADALDRDAARSVRTHPDQGWSLLCNGVILFEDTGEILPTGWTVEPRRGPARSAGSRVARPPAPRRSTTGVPAAV